MRESRPAARWGLAACVLVVWAPALWGTFVYDDLHSVRDNPAITDLARVPDYFVDLDAFSSLKNRMYRPVLLTTYAVDHAVGGGAAWVFKLTNVLLHAGCALLVFSIAQRLRAPPQAALPAALWFGVHPLASEAVNMVNGRSELLAVFGVLGAVRCALAGRDGGRWAWLGVGACTALACGGKEIGVVTPAVLAAVEVCRARPPIAWRASVARVAPAVLVVVIYLIVRRLLFGVATVRSVAWSGGHDIWTGAGRDLVTQLATMALLLPRSLGQALVPVGLSVDPPVPYVRTFADVHVLAGMALLALLTFLALRRPRSRPARAIGAAMAWGTALPWVVLPLNVPLMEHRLYGPLAGLALVVSGFSAGAAQLSPRVTRVVCAGVVAILGPLAAARSLDYRDERILWRQEIQRDPYSVRAANALAGLLLLDGQAAEARELARRAFCIYPELVPARRNFVEASMRLPPDHGDPWWPVVVAEHLSARDPRNPFHRLLLARAWIVAGDAEGDVELYDRADRAAMSVLEVAPAKGVVFRVAALARRRAGDLSGAIDRLRRALELGFEDPATLVQLHDLLAEAGRSAEAERMLRRAVARDPFDPLVVDALRRRAARSGKK